MASVLRWLKRKRGSAEGRQPWTLHLEAPICPPGWSTAPPDFVGIGVPRSGTSWWYRDALEAHPAVASAPGRHKEIHFFDQYAAREVDEDLRDRYARFFPRPPGTIAGEWTPDYLFAPWNLALLDKAAPRSRFLIMLRDPVERFRSEIAPALKGLAESGLNALTVLSVASTSLHSMYRVHIERALETFGRDRVLILQYERCLRDPLGEMQRTHRFLDLEPVDAPPPTLGIPEGTQRRIFPADDFNVPTWLDAHLARAWRTDMHELQELCPGEIDLRLWPSSRIG